MPLWQSDAENMIVRLQLESSKLQSPVTSNPSNAVIQHYHTVSSSCNILTQVRIKPLSSCCHHCTTITSVWSSELPEMDIQCVANMPKDFSVLPTLRLPHFAALKQTSCQQHDFKRKMWTNNGGEGWDWPFFLIPLSPQHYWDVYYFGVHLLTCIP